MSRHDEHPIFGLDATTPWISCRDSRRSTAQIVGVDASESSRRKFGAVRVKIRPPSEKEKKGKVVGEYGGIRGEGC